MSETPQRDWDRDANADWPKTEGSYLGRHWNGDLSLPVSFWVNGVLLNIGVGFVVFIAVYAVANSGNKGAVIGVMIFFLVISVVFSVWQLVGIWRSAENHKQHTGRKGWATVAQILVALGWIGLIVNVVDMIRTINEINNLY